MKLVGLIDADLEMTPLGTRSRLADELCGVALLRRTISQLAACRGLDALLVFCPEAQRHRVAQLLAGLPAQVRARQLPPPPYRGLVRVARKWSLDGWRGGLGGSTALDEYVDPALAALAAQAEQADGVAVFAPGGALLDPELVDAMLAHARAHVEDSKLTFAQAPPGLLPTIFHADLCVQLAEKRVPAGWVLAYRPDDPSIDLVFRPCNFPVPQAVRYASGRLCADTARSWRTLERFIQADLRSAEAIGAQLLAETRRVEDLPREVEIELTTADPLADTKLRPRGARVPWRGPIAPELVSRLARELAERDDDALVVLGGFGDPLLHPEFSNVVAGLRAAGIYGITVNTTGQQLDDACRHALLAARVDAVVFQLDAWHEGTYAELSGGADLNRARHNLLELAAARAAQPQVEPIIVPQLTKCLANVEELDAFYDGWMRSQGCASIAGFSHFANRLPDLTVIDMAPPQRIPCRRLFSRCVVLADGSVVACDQDFTGELILGNLNDQPLHAIWTGDAAETLRNQHRSGELPGDLPCGACREWHRP